MPRKKSTSALETNEGAPPVTLSETARSALERFAQTAEAVAATTKKLEKAALRGAQEVCVVEALQANCDSGFERYRSRHSAVVVMVEDLRC